MRKLKRQRKCKQWYNVYKVCLESIQPFLNIKEKKTNAQSWSNLITNDSRCYCVCMNRHYEVNQQWNVVEQVVHFLTVTFTKRVDSSVAFWQNIPSPRSVSLLIATIWLLWLRAFSKAKVVADNILCLGS